MHGRGFRSHTHLFPDQSYLDISLGLQPYPQKVVRPPKPTPTIFSGGGWSPRVYNNCGQDMNPVIHTSLSQRSRGRGRSLPCSSEPVETVNSCDYP